MRHQINLSYLEDLTGGDGDVMTEMIELFLSETPKQLALMSDYNSAEKWDNLRAEAHKLKPTFLYMGLESLHEMTTEIESKAKKQINLETLTELIQKVDQGFGTVIQTLQEKLESYSSSKS